MVAERLIDVTDEHRPFLADLAFLLISHGPREPFVSGFIAWALGRALMGYPAEFDRASWFLPLDRHDAAETEAALSAETGRLLENAGDVPQQAARLLLGARGTPVAAAQLARLPALPSVERQRPAPEPSPLGPNVSDSDVAGALEALSTLDPATMWSHLDVTREDQRSGDNQGSRAKRRQAVRYPVRRSDRPKPFGSLARVEPCSPSNFLDRKMIASQFA